MCIAQYYAKPYLLRWMHYCRANNIVLRVRLKSPKPTDKPRNSKSLIMEQTVVTCSWIIVNFVSPVVLELWPIDPIMEINGHCYRMNLSTGIPNWNFLRPCHLRLIGHKTDRRTDRQTDRHGATLIASRYEHKQNNNFAVAQCDDYTPDIMYCSGAFVSFRVTAWHKINIITVLRPHTAVIHRTAPAIRYHFRARWTKFIENA